MIKGEIIQKILEKLKGIDKEIVYIYEKSDIEREKIELLVYKKYFKLNEERKEIIDNYEV